MTKTRRHDRGFTLIELLTVITIMAILGGVSISAIPGIRSSYQRKQAVDIVMTTIEQARVAALQSGENVYVILALARDNGVSPDGLIVVGDQPIGSSSTGLVLYTHWVRLPLGVRFRSSLNTLAVSAYPSQVNVVTQLPPIAGNPSYAGFTFNSTGTLAYPASGGLDLALFEGIRGSRGNETARGPSAKAAENGTGSLTDAGLYEVVRLDRYNGRSWMNVSTLVNK